MGREKLASNHQPKTIYKLQIVFFIFVILCTAMSILLTTKPTIVFSTSELCMWKESMKMMHGLILVKTKVAKDLSTTTSSCVQNENLNSKPKDEFQVQTTITIQGFENYISYPEKKILKLQCSTCAYVASSGHMLGSRKGSEIDSMGCVFRSNDAPTIGYEEDVGTRTTVRIVGKKSLRKVAEQLLKDNGSRFDSNFMRISPPIILGLYGQRSFERECKEILKLLPYLRLYVNTKEKYNQVSTLYHKRVTNTTKAKESNGFRTIYFAHEACDDIHVYGINDENFCEHVAAQHKGYKDVPYHYYAGRGINRPSCGVFNHSMNRNGTHDFFKEKRHFKLLIKEWGNIHFHNPQWSEEGKNILSTLL